MTNLLTFNNLEKMESRLDELGFKSVDEKIKYLREVNIDEIDETLKKLGLASNEDIKDVAEFFSGYNSLMASLRAQFAQIQAGTLDISKTFPALSTLAESMKKLGAGIDLSRLRREMFLYKLYKQVNGDVSMYETDIRSLAANWNYTDDEVDRFVSYFEEKGYVETLRVFGKFSIAGVRLTVKGVDHVESELQRGVIGET